MDDESSNWRKWESEKRFVQFNLGESDEDDLPLNAPAPDFDLADLYAKRKTLADFRGQSLLLIFFDPSSSVCRDLVPSLAALRIANPSLLPLIISTGDVEQNRQLFAEHRLWFSVLLQGGSDVLSAYRVKETPRGYLIDDDGKIASGLMSLRTLRGQRRVVVFCSPAWSISDPRDAMQPN